MSEENVSSIEPVVDLDLEILVGVTKNIRMPDGKVITVATPDLEQLFKLSKLGGEMQSAADLSEDQAVQVYADLKAAFVELVPQLKPYRDVLNYQQVFAILNLVVKMAMPSDLSELEKQGITLDDDQKKVLQGFLEASPTS